MSGANNNASISNAAYCEQLLREFDRDRWLASLFAPAQHRPGLTALYAFNCEIERVRDLVSEPLPGEVRLQWWRDLLEGVARGNASGNPVAAELMAAIGRYHLPTSALIALIDAHTHDLYDDLLPSVTDLEGYCGETSSALFRLAALILADGGDPGSGDMAGHAGVAYGVTGVMKSMARHAARGQVFVPADIIATHGSARDDILNGRNSRDVKEILSELDGIARGHLGKTIALLPAVPPAVASAVLPLALVEPTLRRMAKPRFDVFQGQAEPPQWLRQWYLWRFTKRLPS